MSVIQDYKRTVGNLQRPSGRGIYSINRNSNDTAAYASCEFAAFAGPTAISFQIVENQGMPPKNGIYQEAGTQSIDALVSSLQCPIAFSIDQINSRNVDHGDILYPVSSPAKGRFRKSNFSKLIRSSEVICISFAT